MSVIDGKQREEGQLNVDHVETLNEPAQSNTQQPITATQVKLYKAAFLPATQNVATQQQSQTPDTQQRSGATGSQARAKSSSMPTYDIAPLALTRDIRKLRFYFSINTERCHFLDDEP